MSGSKRQSSRGSKDVSFEQQPNKKSRVGATILERAQSEVQRIKDGISKIKGSRGILLAQMVTATQNGLTEAVALLSNFLIRPLQ
jgi:hypothetical protein